MQPEDSENGRDAGQVGDSGRKAGQSAVASGVEQREPLSVFVETGMLAGSVGAVAADAWLVVSSLVMGAPAWAPFRYLSTIVLGLTRFEHGVHIAAAVLVGFVLHLLVMSLLGGIYGFLLAGRNSPSASLLGVCYGVATWVLLQYVAVPLAGPVFSVLVNPFVTAVSMLYYGLTLGHTYALMTARSAVVRRYT